MPDFTACYPPSSCQSQAHESQPLPRTTPHPLPCPTAQRWPPQNRNKRRKKTFRTSSSECNVNPNPRHHTLIQTPTRLDLSCLFFKAPWINQSVIICPLDPYSGWMGRIYLRDHLDQLQNCYESEHEAICSSNLVYQFNYLTSNVFFIFTT